MIIFDVVRAALFSNATYESQSKHKKRFSLSILNNAVSVSMDRRPKSQTENSRRMHLHLPDRASNLT